MRIFFFFILFLSQTCFASDGIYSLQFGLLSQTSEGFYISEETTKIPFRPITKEGSDDFFGFIVEAKNNRGFKGKEDVYLPGSFTPLKGEYHYHQGRWIQWYHVEKNDPLGTYKIEIYIDGKLFKTIAFEVVPD